jgi:hypothetical protein
MSTNVINKIDQIALELLNSNFDDQFCKFTIIRYLCERGYSDPKLDILMKQILIDYKNAKIDPSIPSSLSPVRNPYLLKPYMSDDMLLIYNYDTILPEKHEWETTVTELANDAVYPNGAGEEKWKSILLDLLPLKKTQTLRQYALSVLLSKHSPNINIIRQDAIVADVTKEDTAWFKNNSDIFAILSTCPTPSNNNFIVKESTATGYNIYFNYYNITYTVTNMSIVLNNRKILDIDFPEDCFIQDQHIYMPGKYIGLTFDNNNKFMILFVFDQQLVFNTLDKSLNAQRFGATRSSTTEFTTTKPYGIVCVSNCGTRTALDSLNIKNLQFTTNSILLNDGWTTKEIILKPPSIILK